MKLGIVSIIALCIHIRWVIAQSGTSGIDTTESGQIDSLSDKDTQIEDPDNHGHQQIDQERKEELDFYVDIDGIVNGSAQQARYRFESSVLGEHMSQQTLNILLSQDPMPLQELLSDQVFKLEITNIRSMDLATGTSADIQPRLMMFLLDK